MNAKDKKRHNEMMLGVEFFCWKTCWLILCVNEEEKRRGRRAGSRTVTEFYRAQRLANTFHDKLAGREQ